MVIDKCLLVLNRTIENSDKDYNMFLMRNIRLLTVDLKRKVKGLIKVKGRRHIFDSGRIKKS